ncbi:hypothetical protein BpHYR1_015264 [Brachionus plicatilis]|uniref:Uncharacterized protein n=1 Tax=Brachionus plicatilis TaxID=10195 RepID=A0A3M7Q2Y5_BRAPC|nr:hypothetical protein BpHYR1_015264 [Brachionus plicatilis]
MNTYIIHIGKKCELPKKKFLIHVNPKYPHFDFTVYHLEHLRYSTKTFFNSIQSKQKILYYFFIKTQMKITHFQ